MHPLRSSSILAAGTPSGACTAGACTLADAINAANANSGDDIIEFAIGTGLQTISPTAALPTITSTILIDGTSQPGFGACPGPPVIQLDGTGAGASANGLSIGAGGNGSTIQGLAINRFGADGITINAANNVTVRCSVIGTNPAGASDLGNGLGGIRAIDTSGVDVGGAAIADGNLISGNNNFGVSFESGSLTASNGNTAQNNDLGVNRAGTAAIPNGSHNVIVQSSGDDFILDNVIAGSAQGLTMVNAATVGTIVLGNHIGMNRAGTVAIGN